MPPRCPGCREAACHPGHALTGALAVVTDDAGRVLLGRSRRGMLELPGGKTSGPEDFATAAVRELGEETGLVADPADAYVVTMLVDDSYGIPRLTAVVRIPRGRARWPTPRRTSSTGGSSSTSTPSPASGRCSPRPLSSLSSACVQVLLLHSLVARSGGHRRVGAAIQRTGRTVPIRPVLPRVQVS
ncbi:NUDIX domain-containing protein [Streptomyces sp. NPDC056549]|uniref:NUDIX domain-containing protein n=1 Tax=Streptomyces sp. NPDC056549 TaxID=3345864 RepID=UPI003696EA32